MKQFNLFFIVALCVLCSCSDSKNQNSGDQAESTPTLNNDSLCRARQQQIQDSILQAEQQALAEQEAQANSKEAIYDAYLLILKKNYKYNSTYGDLGYFLMDFTHDGTPELFTRTGTCEADYELNIYTFVDGAVKKLYNTGAGHSSYLTKGDGNLIQFWAHQGAYDISELSYNGKVNSKTIAEGELDFDEDEDYPDCPGRELAFYQFKKPDALRKALDM